MSEEGGLQNTEVKLIIKHKLKQWNNKKGRFGGIYKHIFYPHHKST